jgi:hypothetical protein
MRPEVEPPRLSPLRALVVFLAIMLGAAVGGRLITQFVWGW